MRTRRHIAPVLFALVFALAVPTARASSRVDDSQLDAAALTRLEDHALHAEAREQAYLYTELVQIYTVLAARQMAAGEMEQASLSLKRVEGFVVHVHQAINRDTKKLKDAEKNMETSSFHLRQGMRALSTEDKAAAEATLAKVNGVHQELLAEVFAH